MTDRTVFNQLNIIVSDMDAAVSFYRMLGLEIGYAEGDWPPGSGARHVDGQPDECAHLHLDNGEITRIWASQELPPVTAVIGFRVPTRDAVDEKFAELTAAGYVGVCKPYDAFWGSRYAIVEDPDGHCIGFMNPPEPELVYTPSF